MVLKKYRTSILLGLTFTILLSTFWSMPQLAFIIFISLLLQLLLHAADRTAAFWSEQIVARDRQNGFAH